MLWNNIKSFQSTQKKHKLTFIFFHPDYTVGFGISPNHAFRLVGYTTGRELHPALKIVIQLRTIIIFDIISVNKKFFLVYPNTIICKQVNTGYFLISFCLGNSHFPFWYRLSGYIHFFCQFLLCHSSMHFSQILQIIPKGHAWFLLFYVISSLYRGQFEA